jgi:hypothetical protein
MAQDGNTAGTAEQIPHEMSCVLTLRVNGKMRWAATTTAPLLRANAQTLLDLSDLWRRWDTMLLGPNAVFHQFLNAGIDEDHVPTHRNLSRSDIVQWLHSDDPVTSVFAPLSTDGRAPHRLPIPAHTGDPPQR